MSAGHVSGGDYFGENVSNLVDRTVTSFFDRGVPKFQNTTMYTLKKSIYDAVKVMAFADGPSNWGHLFNTLIGAPNLGVAFATFAGRPHIINLFGYYTGNEITKPNNPATLQAALTKAKADQAAAQTASDAAKAQLTKASSDYAKALELKTQAEKTLADATATPLQTQVAENNRRLAEIALRNAETRKADAQKAVDNFSANLADKKAALDTAKAELTQAQATATAKATALEAAKAELVKQQGTLDSLNKERDALLAEKDRLVEEAKALAEELDGYLNAPAILEKAKATLPEKQAALTKAQAEAKTAHEKLEGLNAKLAEEKAKLAELQTEYDRLKGLEYKVKENVIATLPDGTIISAPKTAPTAQAKPTVDIEAVKAALNTNQSVRIVDGKVVVYSERTANTVQLATRPVNTTTDAVRTSTPQAGVTVTQTATGEKVTYSRVERAKALPQTGAQESILGLAGLAMMSTLGLAGARKKRRG